MIKIIVNTIELEVTSWGKSMYGGWYADYKHDGNYDGIRCDTLQELCNQLHISKTALTRDVQRWDN